ncbi:hypothetical protein [Acidobacterium sp. S8]|uniref:hypothetical protein n=1 Tax=Acidobacterium sp. S8 TaxID=1641854 RepID=UPI00131D2F5E|nr:hypothetical protein [Acidobacterium sp. S8]
MLMNKWVRLPSGWIEAQGLRKLRWGKHGGSGSTAALMVLAPIGHFANPVDGVAQLTYDQLQVATGLSRAKISEGLGLLTELEIIARSSDRRSTFAIQSYGPPEAGGWAKFPTRQMYNAAGNIIAFEDFKLRSRAELEALKLFYLFVARRANDTNMANISYDKIEDYTGIDRKRIKIALSVLTTNNMVHVEQLPRSSGDQGISYAYRVVGIDPHVHQGTRNRRTL